MRVARPAVQPVSVTGRKGLPGNGLLDCIAPARFTHPRAAPGAQRHSVGCIAPPSFTHAPTPPAIAEGGP